MLSLHVMEVSLAPLPKLIAAYAPTRISIIMVTIKVAAVADEIALLRVKELYHEEQENPE